MSAPPTKRVRLLALNSLCALLSLVVALAVCEAALRLFHPRYHHAAEARRELDEQTIWKPSPNSHYRWSHPDTGRSHRVMHNNLGSRQHRDFHPQDLESAVNLAFFGDSFGENLRLPVQYSFHDVLDFLLNASTGEGGVSGMSGTVGGGTRFNVLNFGVSGYGTDQEYILYRNVREQAPLHHVFYLFYWNDLRDVRRNRIYSLDDSGRLVESLPVKPPLRTRALARLHFTYLAIDGWKRLRREWFKRFPLRGKTQPMDEHGAGRPSENVVDPDAIRVWRALVLRWQREVESRGARFTVVGLFGDAVPLGMAALPDSVDTFSLRDCFRRPGHKLRFKRDLHWNEVANMMAAHCLYRFLEERLGLPPVSDEVLVRRRHHYYRAFAEAPDWEGSRWLPEPSQVSPSAPSPLGAGAVVDVVDKYLALEKSPVRLDEHWRRLVRSAQADPPLVRAAWDVYAIWDRRLLVCVKKPCRDENPMKPRWVLRVWPARPAPGWRGMVGVPQITRFVDTGRFFEMWRSDDECAVGVYLPNFGFSKASIGQFVRVAAADGTSRREEVWMADIPFRKYTD